jgi:hypothetical protein
MSEKGLTVPPGSFLMNLYSNAVLAGKMTFAIQLG